MHYYIRALRNDDDDDDVDDDATITSRAYVVRETHYDTRAKERADIISWFLRSRLSVLYLSLSLSLVFFLSFFLSHERFAPINVARGTDGGNDARTVASGTASCERNIRETQRCVRSPLFFSSYSSFSFSHALSAEKHSRAPRDTLVDIPPTFVISFILFRFARVSETRVPARRRAATTTKTMSRRARTF